MAFQHIDLTLPQKEAIRDSLARCEAMWTVQSRAILIRNLHSDIRTSVHEYPDEKSSILEIVETCAEFAGGLLQLLQALRLQHDNEPFRRFLGVLERTAPCGRSANWSQLLDLVSVLEKRKHADAELYAAYQRAWPHQNDRPALRDLQPLMMQAILQDLADADLEWDDSVPLVNFAEAATTRTGDSDLIDEVKAVTDLLLAERHLTRPEAKRRPEEIKQQHRGSSQFDYILQVEIDKHPQRRKAYTWTLRRWSMVSSERPKEQRSTLHASALRLESSIRPDLSAFIEGTPIDHPERTIIEFILPCELMCLGVENWTIRNIGDDCEIGALFPVVLRSLFRFRSHRELLVTDNPSPEYLTLHQFSLWKRRARMVRQPPPPPSYHVHGPVDALLSLKSRLRGDLDLPCLGILSTPSCGKPELLEACLRFGLPILVWVRSDVGQELPREDFEALLKEADPTRLPVALWEARGGGRTTEPERKQHIGQYISLLWDLPEIAVPAVEMTTPMLQPS